MRIIPTIPEIIFGMGCKLPSTVSILDIGCGISFLSQHIPADIHVAFDAYRPYLENIKTDISYVPVQGKAQDISKIFLPNSFDMVIATDILEHLVKKDALKVIVDMEVIARKVIYVEMPETYIPQNIDIWGLGGHYWQTHRSTGEWSKGELEKLGFTVSRREYKMSDVKRHEDSIDPNIIKLDGVKIL